LASGIEFVHDCVARYGVDGVDSIMGFRPLCNEAGSAHGRGACSCPASGAGNGGPWIGPKRATFDPL
jgi:hypothetical protein